MFKLFSKSKSDNDTNFMTDLAAVAADFNYITDHLDEGSAEIFMSRAVSFRKDRTADEAEFIASDFYFDAFTGATFEITNNEVISAAESARFWALTDSFLDENPKYRTSVVTTLMNRWYEILMRFGVV